MHGGDASVSDPDGGDNWFRGRERAGGPLRGRDVGRWTTYDRSGRGAATTASAALPLATAAASGAVRVPGAEEDLHRYELLLSEAEDFGETW